MAEDEGHRVVLNVYDLSQGLARQLSASFLGKVVEGIWHTGVVVYGNEYYFSGGIQQSSAGTTPYGTPLRVVDLGVTHIPKEVFEDYLQEISPRYTAETYSILSHNCNNFSNEVAQFLVDTTIPGYILQLPNEVMNSPFGHMILPMIQQLDTTLRSGAVPQAPQFRPPSSVAQPSVNGYVVSTQGKTDNSVKPDNKATENLPKLPEPGNASPSVAVEHEKKSPAVDPLGEARSRVQEEITREFVAIMASGEMRASEAAALATRRVMERHGRINVPMQQG